MVFVKTRELRQKTKETFEKVDKGEYVFVTHYGKPRAVIQRITEDDLEDFILMNHPKFKKQIKQAYKEALEGKGTDLDEMIAETEGEIAEI